MKVSPKLDVPGLKQGHFQIHDILMFEGIDASLLAAFEVASQHRHVAKGTVLYIQGDEAEWFHLIQSGWVKLFRETIEGSEAIVDVITRGHLFGENTVFENGCYSYSAQAVEDVELISFPTKLLKDSIEKDPKLATNMLQSMSRYRLQQHREIEHFNVQNAPQRIGCFLLRLILDAPEAPVTLHLPYDKTLIAGRLGMKPETFSRALAKLKEATNLRVHGSSVTIPSVSILADYVCSHCSNSFPCEE